MKDLVETLGRDGRFRTLQKAIRTAGLTDALQARGPFTLFAPTDDAFNRLPASDLDRLLADRPRLINLVLYHVVPGNLTKNDLDDMQWARTLAGDRLAITQDFDTVLVNGAQVVQSDIAAVNGVMHVIDRVLLPAREPVSGI